MTKTSTPIHPNNLAKKVAKEQLHQSEENFYQVVKPQLDQLYREPSDETIAKILDYAKKR